MTLKGIIFVLLWAAAAWKGLKLRDKKKWKITKGGVIAVSAFAVGLAFAIAAALGAL